MRWSALPFVAIVGVLACWAGSANAESRCQGQPAHVGQTVRGPVLEVLDANTVCVAKGGSPSDWIAVTLAQPAPNRPALMAAAFGKNATCVIRTDGRGVCIIEGAVLSTVLERRGLIRTSMDWR